MQSKGKALQDGPIKAVVDGKEIELAFENGLLTAAGVPLDASLVHVGGSTYSLLLDGKSYELTIQRNGGSVQVTESGIRREVKILDRAAILVAALEGSAGSRRHALEVRAPMPGLVLAVEVEEGASINAGQGVIVLEAMKMENEIFAAGAGVVDTIHVSRGDAVTKGQILITLSAA